ncbi:MAG: hypothetical protein E4G91_09710 [Candidatus Zixiibacteriota bacterium]|nr:MAG: hypothetical protein E4G91_09710 [candidate division Zixibacteria bacterium]
MVYKRLSQQIAETRVDDVKTLDSMTETILEKSYKDPREVVGLAHSEDENIQTTASALLLSLGNLSLSPLLDSAASDIPEDYVWDMQTAAKLHLDSRGRIVKALEKMLTDVRPVDVGSPFSFKEEKPVARRVCDEAYLLLRKLLAFEENEEDRMLNELTFLNMEDKERDSEIKRFLQTKTWISLIETTEVE